MYPAIEIDLHFDRICAAQGLSSAALETAFRAVSIRHQPAPHRHILAEGADRGVVIPRRRRRVSTLRVN
jgi:hypothetical protein